MCSTTYAQSSNLRYSDHDIITTVMSKQNKDAYYDVIVYSYAQKIVHKSTAHTDTTHAL